MGFPETRSRKAAIKTNNTGAEAAMNWLLEHMDDPDIDDSIESSQPESEPASGNLIINKINIQRFFVYQEIQRKASQCWYRWDFQSIKQRKL